MNAYMDMIVQIGKLLRVYNTTDINLIWLKMENGNVYICNKNDDDLVRRSTLRYYFKIARQWMGKLIVV